jgi:hypothetical protein
MRAWLMNLLLGLLLASSGALAQSSIVGKPLPFGPETGAWWNPSESGRGYWIEVQDNYLLMHGFAYTAAGQPLWFQASGLMSGNAGFDATLYSFKDGQCFGCAFRVPVIGQNYGTVSLRFKTETTADLYWPGIVTPIPIQRFDYYLTRTTGDVKSDQMLGEWQLVAESSDGVDRFDGDILVYDGVDRSYSPDVIVGCRPDSAIAARCSSNAVYAHRATGFYDAPSGLHYLILDSSSSFYRYYVVRSGFSQFDGILKLCSKSLSASARISQCVQNSSVPAYYVRGFRTASRNFVLNRSGPNAVTPDPKSALVKDISSVDRISGAGLDADTIKELLGTDLQLLPTAQLLQAEQALAQ